eukprot:2770791-Amphidinium_carterae.1
MWSDISMSGTSNCQQVNPVLFTLPIRSPQSRLENEHDLTQGDGANERAKIISSLPHVGLMWLPPCAFQDKSGEGFR